MQEYEKQYNNLVCIDKQNEGVSIARNTGLERASGEYVWIVDADDWIARDCLGLIKRELLAHEPSVLQVNFDWIKAQWRVEECAQARLQAEKVKCSTCGVSLLPYVGAWSSVIKRSLLERYGHRFIEHLHYGEDVLFIRELTDRMRLEEEAENGTHTMVHCRDDIFYYYRLHDESACRSSWTQNRKRYMEALLQMARIDQERMKDTSKPKWYRDQYEELFFQRIHNYMLYWLPGDTGEWKDHKLRLKMENLYPCPKPPKNVYHFLTKGNGVKEKIIAQYHYFAFRWPKLYPLYYQQKKKKYQKVDRDPHT